MRAKYILVLVLTDINNRRLEALVFSESMAHIDVGTGFGFGDHVVSAGFVGQNMDGSYFAHGHSETLGIASNPELDNDYINRAMGRDRSSMSKEKRLEDYGKGVDITHARRASKKGPQRRDKLDMHRRYRRED